MKIGGGGTISENPVRRSNLHNVYVAMHAIAEQRELSAVLMTYKGKLAVVEGFAHELAHQLEAGRDFAARIRNCDDEKANDHEASTLRIEVAALAVLGVRVSLRKLWQEANWRDAKPILTKKRRLLNKREQRCVAAFRCLVKRAIQSGASS